MGARLERMYKHVLRAVDDGPGAQAQEGAGGARPGQALRRGLISFGPSGAVGGSSMRARAEGQGQGQGQGLAAETSNGGASPAGV